jgi:hypothetical protein
LLPVLYGIEHDLPVPNVDPLTEFVPHLLELGGLLETELLVEGNTSVIRERDTAHHCVKTPALQVL